MKPGSQVNDGPLGALPLDNVFRAGAPNKQHTEFLLRCALVAMPKKKEKKNAAKKISISVRTVPLAELKQRLAAAQVATSKLETDRNAVKQIAQWQGLYVMN